MYLHKAIKIPLYQCKVYIYVVTNIKDKVKTIEKSTKGEWSIPYEGESGGLYFSLGVSQYHIIYRSDCLSHYYISHEIQHFVDEITEHRGMDSEQRAYINGFITQEIHNFLKSKNITVE